MVTKLRLSAASLELATVLIWFVPVLMFLSESKAIFFSLCILYLLNFLMIVMFSDCSGLSILLV